jgi:tetratricopeptide (TPR) repeat protein
MDAVISGRVGKALLLEGDSLRSFDVDDPGTLVSMVASDYQLLFGDAPDLQFLEDTDAAAVARALEFEHNCACALDVALISLDPELSTELRAEAVGALEELIRDERVLTRLENILYAEPLPPAADLRGALEQCEASRAAAVRTTFEILEHHQQAIREVKLAWDAIPLRTFEDEENRAQFKHLAVHEGLFRSLVLARGSQPRINRFRVNSLLNPSVKKIRHSREVLEHWVAPFLVKSNAPVLALDAEEVERQETHSERLRRRGRQSYNRARVLENVERQKELIVNAMQRRDLVRAREVIDELIEYHMEYGGAEFAVKSLCDLAMAAKALGNYHLQLELTERCIDLQPSDAWSWTQHADALLQMQRPNEALAAYEQAIAFGRDVVARNGRAEVLKALGRYDEALAAFNETVAEHPEDVVAKNGRAEVLKAMGRLDEALAAYDAAVAEHPESVVAKTGRAEALKALGSYGESLAAYNEAVAEHPESVVARNGRAEVLKALGRYDEALAAFNETVAEHPEDVVAKNGRAEVLKAMGRLDEALAAYDAAVAEHPESVVARNGRAEALKALGKYEDALTAYEETIREHSEDVVARRGRAELLREWGRLEGALAAYNSIIVEYPKDVVAKAGRAEVLKAMGRLDEALAAYDAAVAEHPEDVVAKTGRAEALKALGKYEDALTAYEETIREHSESIVARRGRAELLREWGRLEGALAAYNSIIVEYPKDVVAKAGRAEVLKAMGRLDEALAAYDAAVAEHPESVVAKNGRAEALKAMGRYGEALTAYDVVIAEHPESIIAQRGRAEVLKTCGRLEEALAAYDAISIRMPQDAFTRNGRSSVLLALRRFDEALEALPERNISTIQDWIGFHIRGMVLLRMGRLDDAVEVFKRGVTENPWGLDKEVFRAALALVRLKRRDFTEAKKMLDEVSSAQLKPQVNILRLHSCGELGQDECAIAAYESLSAEPWAIADDLMAELHRRYILKEEPQHDDDWLIEKESEALMPPPSQYATASQAYAN